MLSQAERRTVLTTALELFRRSNPSGDEVLISSFVREVLVAQQFIVASDAMGNVMATRGVPVKGSGYPLLSFHLDSVQQDPPVLRPREAIRVEQGVFHSGGRFVLGGDDKCGAAIALAIATHTRIPLKILASVQEEWGSLGIVKVPPDFFSDVAYALVLDRRGCSDLITDIGGFHTLCTAPFSQALVEAALTVSHRVHPTDGLFSDAFPLSLWIDNVVNLSVGYYYPHSPLEYTIIADLLQAYRWVKAALRFVPHPFPTSFVGTHRLDANEAWRSEGLDLQGEKR